MSYGERRFGGGNRFGGSFGPKPVETGKEYDVQITETSRQGDGIARVQGFVIFVKGGKVGQSCKLKRKYSSSGGKCECICHKRPNTDYCGYCSPSHTRGGTSSRR